MDLKEKIEKISEQNPNKMSEEEEAEIKADLASMTEEDKEIVREEMLKVGN